MWGTFLDFPDAETLNVLIWMGKWYVNNSKKTKKHIVFDFLTIIRDELKLKIWGAALVGCGVQVVNSRLWYTMAGCSTGCIQSTINIKW